MAPITNRPQQPAPLRPVVTAQAVFHARNALQTHNSNATFPNPATTPVQPPASTYPLGNVVANFTTMQKRGGHQTTTARPGLANVRPCPVTAQPIGPRALAAAPAVIATPTPTPPAVPIPAPAPVVATPTSAPPAIVDAYGTTNAQPRPLTTVPPAVGNPTSALSAVTTLASATVSPAVANPTVAIDPQLLAHPTNSFTSQPTRLASQYSVEEVQSMLQRIESQEEELACLHAQEDIQNGIEPDYEEAPDGSIPKPRGLARLNLQIGMGLQDNRGLYNEARDAVRGCVAHLKDQFLVEWGNQDLIFVQTIVNVANSRCPYLKRFRHGWATHEILRTSNKNKRRHKKVLQADPTGAIRKQKALDRKEGMARMKKRMADREEEVRRDRDLRLGVDYDSNMVESTAEDYGGMAIEEISGEVEAAGAEVGSKAEAEVGGRIYAENMVQVEGVEDAGMVEGTGQVEVAIVMGDIGSACVSSSSIAGLVDVSPFDDNELSNNGSDDDDDDDGVIDIPNGLPAFPQHNSAPLDSNEHTSFSADPCKFPFPNPASNTDDVLFSINATGMTPIASHPHPESPAIIQQNSRGKRKNTDKLQVPQSSRPQKTPKTTGPAAKLRASTRASTRAQAAAVAEAEAEAAVASAASKKGKGKEVAKAKAVPDAGTGKGTKGTNKKRATKA